MALKSRKTYLYLANQDNAEPWVVNHDDDDWYQASLVRSFLLFISLIFFWKTRIYDCPDDAVLNILDDISANIPMTLSNSCELYVHIKFEYLSKTFRNTAEKPKRLNLSAITHMK